MLQKLSLTQCQPMVGEAGHSAEGKRPLYRSPGNSPNDMTLQWGHLSWSRCPRDAPTRSQEAGVTNLPSTCHPEPVLPVFRGLSVTHSMCPPSIHSTCPPSTCLLRSEGFCAPTKYTLKSNPQCGRWDRGEVIRSQGGALTNGVRAPISRGQKASLPLFTMWRYKKSTSVAGRGSSIGTTMLASVSQTSNPRTVNKYLPIAEMQPVYGIC